MKAINSFLLVLSATFFFTSCGYKTPYQRLVNETDVVKVFISSGATVPMVHYATNDIDKIKLWKTYIDENANSTSDCQYEGKLIFKVYEDSTEMKFSLMPGCEQVEFTLSDTLFIKKLSPEGIAFLNNLKSIR